MAVNIDDAAAYVGARLSQPGQAVEEWVYNRKTLERLVPEAMVMVEEYLRPKGLERIPVEIFDMAVIQLVSELWTRRKSPGGVSQWGKEGTPTYLRKDPMASVKPILDRYRGIGAVG